jgi:hypothetical protein
MTRREGEHVRTAATSPDHVGDIEPQVVEKLGRVVRDGGDTTPWQSSRGPIAGSIERDDTHVETVVGLFMRVTRVPRTRSSLKPELWTAVRGTVLAPRQCPSVTQGEASVHARSIARRSSLRGRPAADS